MPEPFLSRFTPSLMSAEVLESTFVQREPLAQRLVDLIRESASGSSRQHTLLIGPRGIGKTHLVALIYHRLRADEELGKRLLIAWLREEEWGVGSFLDFLIRILSTLRSEYGDAGLETFDLLYELAPDAAEERAADLLIRYLGGRTLLVIAENLDDIFAGLGSVGQRRLRAFLQEHGLISLLAASQSLFNGVSVQTSPFYGFFRIHHLDELDFQDAVRLLIQIANLTGKEDLAASLQTPVGRARIRAVHHLAGGNPRIYVIFSQFLTSESLEELVDPFMRLLDDLTPYYQARMAWISPQQRKIVDFLRERRGGVTVKEIAKHCFLSPQAASSQLKDLKDMGYVRSISAGRESYYELKEPLMRLCLDVKRHRGEPVRLFVEFLRAWYSRHELESQLRITEADSIFKREYLVRALQFGDSDHNDPRIQACISDLRSFWGRGDYEGALTVADELVAIRGSSNDWFIKGVCLALLKRYNMALAANEEALLVHPGDERLLAQKSMILGASGDSEHAKEFVLGALRSAPESVVLWFVFLVSWWPDLSITGLVEDSDGLWDIAFSKKPRSLDGLLSEAIKIFAEKETLAALALGLIISMVGLLRPEAKALLRIWQESWARVAVGVNALRVPLRLLDKALIIAETRDERPLLELPVEERKLLQALYSGPPMEFSFSLNTDGDLSDLIQQIDPVTKKDAL